MEYDQAQLLQIGRFSNDVDPRLTASKNKAEFKYDFKINLSALENNAPFCECVEKKLFVKIATPATRDIAYIPATNDVIALYRSAYDMCMMKETAEASGTPLATVKEFSPALRDCYGFGIFTVERLASIVDSEIAKNEGLNIYAKLANRFLDSKARNVINSPEKQVTQQLITKRRGRPPKRLANVNGERSHQPSAT